jgi:hypothetical protein
MLSYLHKVQALAQHQVVITSNLSDDAIKLRLTSRDGSVLRLK